MPMELSRVNLRELATGVLDAWSPFCATAMRTPRSSASARRAGRPRSPQAGRDEPRGEREPLHRTGRPHHHRAVRLKGNSILAVKDDGTGFGDIDPSCCFDRFYRTDASRNSQSGGYGLGLSIAKSIVTAHKGKIRAESPDGTQLSIQVTLAAG